LTLHSLKPKTPYVIATQHELDNVELFALSQNFEKIIRVLSQERPLIVITGPVTAGNLSFAEPFLIASHGMKCINLQRE
jgi:hypothetical protein